MNVNLRLLTLIILLLMLLLFLLLLLLITLYLVVIKKCWSEAHGAHVECLWWWGGVGFAQSFLCQLLFRLTRTGLSDWTGVWQCLIPMFVPRFSQFCVLCPSVQKSVMCAATFLTIITRGRSQFITGLQRQVTSDTKGVHKLDYISKYLHILILEDHQA